MQHFAPASNWNRLVVLSKLRSGQKLGLTFIGLIYFLNLRKES